MNDSEILIVGAYGQLGKALAERFPGARAVDRDGLDITSVQALEAFDWSGIKYLLNAAAYTNVDGAETPEGRRTAWAINAAAVANLARVAVERDLTVVHVSSETVYDGSQSAHREDEGVAPLGVYAQTKAAGDMAVRVAPKHYIVRTMWLVGDGPNFVKTMMGLAAKNISPRVVGDQVGRLTFSSTLVDAIEVLLKKRADYGIYHVSDDGDVVSWAEVTRAIFRELGRDDLSVTDITTPEYFKDKPTSAPRPLKGDYDLAKIKSAGVKLPDWREELHDYIKREQGKEVKSS
ncbi:MAG TPA: NAD(P)-dependent oxidoreductase [Candidatus Saccharimonadia bacterium]|nr:NAD(P)-dependent oxidoreductase [Candidatus Saccharimonadia bacterium]